MSVWSSEKALDWYSKQGWLVGCNFLPSSSINQIEMFQENTFDITEIRRELSWAKDLGFNTLRVYLHDLLWDEPNNLFNKLDAFLGFPVADPHGDPIPNAKGVIKKIEKQLLSEVEINAAFHCIGVKDSSAEFLKYLDKQKIALGNEIKVLGKEPFDDSIQIQIANRELSISNKIANNLYIKIL